MMGLSTFNNRGVNIYIIKLFENLGELVIKVASPSILGCSKQSLRRDLIRSYKGVLAFVPSLKDIKRPLWPMLSSESIVSCSRGSKSSQLYIVSASFDVTMTIKSNLNLTSTSFGKQLVAFFDQNMIVAAEELLIKVL